MTRSAEKSSGVRSIRTMVICRDGDRWMRNFLQEALALFDQIFEVFGLSVKVGLQYLSLEKVDRVKGDRRGTLDRGSSISK